MTLLKPSETSHIKNILLKMNYLIGWVLLSDSGNMFFGQIWSQNY